MDRKKGYLVYVEEKTDGEALPAALHDSLSELIQRARDLIADPTHWFKLGPKFHGQHCVETALSQVWFDTFLPNEAHGLALSCINTAVQRLYPHHHPHFNLPAGAFQRSRIDNP